MKNEEEIEKVESEISTANIEEKETFENAEDKSLKLKK